MRWLTLALLAPSAASAATLEVDASGGAAYSTIGSALAAASPGDTVLVYPGTYNEVVTLQNTLFGAVNLVSSGGSAVTTIRGDGTRGTLYLNSAQATVRGFTIRPVTNGHRALYVSGSAATLDDLVIRDGYGVEGAGALISASFVTIEDSVFADNDASAAGSGGHLLVVAGAVGGNTSVTVRRTTFERGIATDGGAIALGSGCDLDLADSELLDNLATDSGGAIAIQSGSLTIDDSMFSGNQCGGAGGAIAIASASFFEITDATFAENVAADEGGAIRVVDPYDPVVLDGVDFTDNEATHGAALSISAASAPKVRWTGGSASGGQASGYGGVLHTNDPVDIEIDDVDFAYNTATFGGALAVLDPAASAASSLTLTGCSFAANLADESGGAIYADVYALDTHVTDSSFQENFASNEGGAIYMIDDASTLAVADSVFDYNGADRGGALHLELLAALEVRRSSFCQDLSFSSDGAVVYARSVSGDDVWTNNVLVDNESQGSGAIRVVGGKLRLINNHLLGNRGFGGAGGSVVATQIDELDLVNNLFAWTPGSSGPAVRATFNSGSSYDLRYNDWWSNNSGNLGGDLGAASFGTGNIFQAPLLAAYTPGGDCDAQQLAPGFGSPLIDAGDPALTDTDPQQTRSDIGAYGGPEADPSIWADGDNDTWSSILDCNDDDDTIYPGANDPLCDGVDSDCDGVGGPGSDEDGDGLTWLVEQAHGASDCDDDSDDDGLLDADEYALGTRLDDEDSDNDGLDDYEEVVVLGTDPLLKDSDGDGLDDPTEVALETDPNDEDSDGDGLDDALEVGDPLDPNDIDDDDIIDALDEDDDGDAVPTKVERAWHATSWMTEDTDGDGLLDGQEWGPSWNPNWQTATFLQTVAPRNSDSDGFYDFLDEDDDDDLIPTSVEMEPGIDPDIDDDGTPNHLDANSDGTGASDLIEGRGDLDEDGIENWADADDADGVLGDGDNDGIPNGVERDELHTDPALWDTDGDGVGDLDEVVDIDNPLDTDHDDIIDALDDDDDGDGVLTIDEDPNGDGDRMNADTDHDLLPDFRDDDDDGDGILTRLEDWDGNDDAFDDDHDDDDIPDFLDDDDDGDGIPTLLEGTGDPDGDDVPNHLDDDSDGDGYADVVEGAGDEDDDDIGSWLDDDSDGDSVLDADELDEDRDGDDLPDRIDPDDDGDSHPTLEEGTDDLDEDGEPNYLDVDSDGDGAFDSTELGDADEDGIPDYLDAGVEGAEPVPDEKPKLGCATTGPRTLGGLPLLVLALVRRRCWQAGPRSAYPVA